MDFTINCTRVPIPVGTLFEGVPVEIGPAPAISGLDSDLVSPRESHDSSPLNPNGQGGLDCENERPNNSSVARNKPYLAHSTPAL